MWWISLSLWNVSILATALSHQQFSQLQLMFFDQLAQNILSDLYLGLITSDIAILCQLVLYLIAQVPFYLFLFNTWLSRYHPATCWSCTALHDWQLPMSSLSLLPLQKSSASYKVSHLPMCMWWWWWKPIFDHFVWFGCISLIKFSRFNWSWAINWKLLKLIYLLKAIHIWLWESSP